MAQGSICTDEFRIYDEFPNRSTVNHCHGQYVREGGMSTDGLESCRALVKRSYMGACHWWSPKRVKRFEPKIGQICPQCEYGYSGEEQK